MSFVTFSNVRIDVPVEYKDYISAQKFVAPRLFVGDPTQRPSPIGAEGVVVQRAGDTYGYSATGDVALYFNPSDEPICVHPRTKNVAGGFIIKCPPFSIGQDGVAVFHAPGWLLDRTSVAGTPVDETQTCDGGSSQTQITAQTAFADFSTSGSATVINPEARFTPDPIRFAQKSTVANGTIARSGWGVFQATSAGSAPAAWAEYRNKPRPVDSAKIRSALIYDLDTEIVQDVRSLTRPIVRRSPQTPRSEPMAKKSPQTIAAEPLRLSGIDIYDPFVGLIPSAAAREIAIISESDPASYSDDSAWGAVQVGKLWWDTSRSPYLEAQTDVLDTEDQDRLAREVAYRKANWGKFAPGSDVGIWEWVRRSEAPEINAVVPNNSLGVPLVIREEYDDTLGRMASVYYYWVLNNTEYPVNIPGRTLTALQIAQLLADPTGEGIAYLAPIMPNGMLVANLDPYLDNVDTVLQIDVAQNDYDGVVHHEWALARDGDDRLPPPDDLLRAMNHALCGVDDFGNAVPDPSLPERDRMGFSLRPRRSLVAIDRADMLAARQSFVGIVNAIFARSNLTTLMPDILSDLTLSAPTYSGLIWTQPANSKAIEVPPPNTYDFVATSLAERDAILTSHAYRVACGFLSPSVGFAPQYCVRYRSPRILVTNYEADRPSWSIWEVPPGFFGTDAAAQHPATTLVLSSAYDLECATYADLIAAIGAGTVSEGQRCLIATDERYDGVWTIFYYAPSSYEAETDGLVFETAQGYRTSDFVSAVDWYASGYSVSNPPLITYPTLARRNAVEGPTPTNTFVNITDDGSGHWIWTYFDGTSWTMVARQAGTVALSSAFYDATRTVFSGSESDLASVATRDGAAELRQIELALRTTVLSKSEINEVFFSLLHFVHTRQDQVDWAFKTSFLSIVGFNEKLLPTPVASYDTTENLIDYIDEVKPYRVKTRDFTRMLTPPIEAVNTRPTDFDKPVYYDAAIQAYRRLDPASPADMRLMAQTSPWSAWYAAYRNTGLDPSAAGFNPVRRMRMTLRFDRINIGLATPGDSCTAWDTVPYDLLAYDADGTHIDDEYSALARLIAWYDPKVGSVARDQTDELLGLGFGGTQVDGGTFTVTGNDIPVDGRDGSTPGVTLNANGLGQPYTFRDPLHAAGRPPELAVALVNEGLSLTAKTRYRAGAPRQASVFMTTRNVRRSTMRIPYPLIASCDASVLVYRDGVRARLGVDYTIDHAGRAVVADLTVGPKPRQILVHVFAAAGTGSIVAEATYAGDAVTSSFAIDRLSEAAIVEATVDGTVLAANTVSRSTTQVSLGVVPAAGASIALTGYATGSMPTRPVTETLAYNGQQTWTLTTPSTTIPASAGTIVEVAGMRLMPPFTRYGTIAGNDRIIPLGRAVEDVANLTVYLDGVAFTGSIAQVLGDLRSDATTAPAFGITDGIAVIGTDLYVSPSVLDHGRVIVVLREGHEYDIVPGVNGRVLTIVKPLGLGNWGSAGYDDFGAGEAYTVDPNLSITATTFLNDDVMGIETHVFAGSVGGAYVIPSAAGADCVSVWLDGLRLVDGQNVTAFRGALGADSGDADGAVGFDVAQSLVVTIPGGQEAWRRVLVTAYAGPPARPPSVWRLTSAVPGPALMGQRILFDDPNASPPGTPSPVIVETTLGPRMTYQMKGSYEVFGFDTWADVVLATDLSPGDETIVLTANPRGNDPRMVDADPLTLPDLAAGTPGVVQIGPERIEYFALDRTGSTITLGQLRRGSRLTPQAAPQPVSTLFAGNGTQVAITLAGASIALPIEVGVRRSDGQCIPLHRDTGYDVAAVSGGVVVTLSQPPATGETAYALQDRTSAHLAGTPVRNVTPSIQASGATPFGRYSILNVIDTIPSQDVYRS